MSDLSGHVPVSDLFRVISATKARDLSVGDRGNLEVRHPDSLIKVLKQMTSYDVGAVPVLDGEGRLVGDLTIGQVLMKALEVGDH